MKEEEIDQLIQDESFLNYCFQRNKEDIRYWENWLFANPKHADDIASLKKRVLLIAAAAREKMMQQHFSELQERIVASNNKGRNYLRWSTSVAASIILFLSVGGYFILSKNQKPPLATQEKLVRDINPGSNKAVLTLGNGQQVVLTDASNGAIALQGNAIVNKTADGQIIYDAKKESQTAVAEQVINTIVTPRGGQWFVTLSDGTKVWLNAASSITYPVVFTGKERKVSITGEAYFEVVHNTAKPFRVQAGNMLVEDIGTAFNVHAYADEPSIKTTLVNGSAKISGKEEAHILIPGQQAIVKMNENAIRVKSVNVEQVVSWKNGQLLFENEDLATIMREVSRWYDVDVLYRGDIPNRLFAGAIPRKSNLSEFLKILEYENVHYTLDHHTITIRP
ncbi:FecR domain-containing protein [Chitinophagaceae bacterium 26-R-25]|nr:FecR domain-containing protein [Chitinophagaceae bacterium 26-R-25]